MPLSPDDERHGERRGYLAGCREECCRTATTEYMAGYSADPTWRERQAKFNKASRHRRHLLAVQGVERSMQPAQPVRDHLQRLKDLGWTDVALAAVHGGVSHGTISQMFRVRNETVQYKTFTLIDLPYTLWVPPHIPDTCMVPVAGAQRRVRALLALGWTHQQQEMQGDNSRIRNILDAGQITAAKWRRINDRYQVLGRKNGPSVKTRAWARKLGYLSPAAWEDIDDPDETPSRGASSRDHQPQDYVDEQTVLRRMGGDKTVMLHRAESEEIVRRLAAMGYRQPWINAQTGLKTDRYREAYHAGRAVYLKGQAA